MPNSYFQFKQFRIEQGSTAMKVTTDACLFGAWIASTLKADQVLDVGAGTGLLSLMLAQASAALIDAIEIEQHAFKELKYNIDHSPFHARIRAVCGDARTLPTTSNCYDAIISNPPFYSNDLHSPLVNKNMAHHDLHLTLSDLSIIVNTELNANGSFYCLLPYRRKDEVLAIFNVAELVEVRSTSSHAPSRIMIRATHAKQTLNHSELIIKEGDEYTTDFVRLLQPYYLNL